MLGAINSRRCFAGTFARKDGRILWHDGEKQIAEALPCKPLIGLLLGFIWSLLFF
jgi:hypothetical protein